MKRDKYILEELIKMKSSLEEIHAVNLHSVPADYFEHVSLLIIEKIKSGAQSVYFFSPVVPFLAPDRYFENVAENIVEKIRSVEVYNETDQIAPMLNNISKTPAYSVPDHFFENIQKPGSLLFPKEAKVINFKGSYRLRYFAAAVIVFLAFIGIFLMTGKEVFHSSSQAFNTRSEVKNLSEEEIIRFLKTSTSTENVTSALLKTPSPKTEIKQGLKEMSDEEIQQFLQDTHEPGGI